MAHEHLIAPIRQRLKETRSTRNRRAMDLSELESEADSVRDEIAVLDRIIAQDEAEINRLLTESFATNYPAPKPSNVELEAAMARDTGGTPPGLYPVPQGIAGFETFESRFADRTIPQATAMILRESGGPLHVNDIHQLLVDGGFKFSGHNPTISIAVSLNRNRRFRKTAPGTFDLVMRDVAHAR
jgi:hypothetical protein